jgi:AraC-like DNA-binding protein
VPALPDLAAAGRRSYDRHDMPQPTTSPRRDRLDIAEWRRLVRASFVPLEIEPLHVEFVGAISSRVVDEVAVFDIAATPHRVRRTSALIAAGDEPYFKLSLQLEGDARLSQDGRTADIRPGDLAIYDTTRPYELVFDGDSRALVIMFPQRVVDLPAASVAEVTAVVFSRESALGRVIIPFLTELGTSIERLQGPDGIRLVHSALDLLVTLLSSRLHVETDPRRRLTQDIRAYVDARLGDTSLTPASIAQAHFISVRHLHATFSADGVTLAAWIRERRLDRIRRDLADPMHVGESLHQIAARWGLSDAAHFSRLFRSRFGESPRDHRRRALADKQPASAS